MAAYAMCPRDAPKTLDPPAIETNPSQTARKNTPPKPRKWQPLNLDAIENNTHRVIAPADKSPGPAPPSSAKGPKSLDLPRPQPPAASLNNPKGKRRRKNRGQHKHSKSEPLNNQMAQGPPDHPQHQMPSPATTNTENLPPHLRKKTAPEYIPPHLRKKAGAQYVAPHLRKGPKKSTGEPAKPANGASATNTTTKAPPKPHHPTNGLNQKSEETLSPPAEEPVIWGGWGASSEQPNWGNSVVCQSRPNRNARPKALPSPPYSPPKQNAPKQQQNGQWRGRNPPRGPAQQHKKTVWPKNRDMKPQPIDDDQSEGGVPCAKSGTGTEYDVKQLMDWNGDWLPASVEWASRKPFMQSDLTKTVDKWADEVHKAWNPDTGNGIATHNYGFIPINSPPYAEPGCKVGEQAWIKGGDFVHQLWIPTRIDGESPQQFWRTYPAQAPPPEQEGDLLDSRLWWEQITIKDHCQLPLLEHPDAPLDPNDEEYEGKGWRTTAQQALNRRHAAEKKRYEKQMAVRRGAIIQAQAAPELDIPDDSLKPTANFYLRPVLAATDAKPITDLYNHYVKNSVLTPEFLNCTEGGMYARIQEVVGLGLPWIVAVQRGKGRARQPNSAYGGENIVGFACLDDMCNKGSTWRYSFELDMWVHHEHLHMGIGKCMMDQILKLVNPSYSGKGGYDWRPRGDYLRHGCTRVVKAITFTFPHVGDVEDPEHVKLEWVDSFMKDFNFRKAGHIYGLGYKYGKCVDKVIFQTITGEDIIAAQPPMEPM